MFARSFLWSFVFCVFLLMISSCRLRMSTRLRNCFLFAISRKKLPVMERMKKMTRGKSAEGRTFMSHPTSTLSSP